MTTLTEGNKVQFISFERALQVHLYVDLVPPIDGNSLLCMLSVSTASGRLCALVPVGTGVVFQW